MLISDIFPIDEAKIPKLYSYGIQTSVNKASISGKLAYRLKKQFPGHWAAVGGALLSDHSLDQDTIQKFLESQWQLQNSPFENLRRVIPKGVWNPTAFEVSEFVARGLLSDYQTDIISKIRDENFRAIDGVSIERHHDFRGWVVNGRPSISISISSKIFLEKNLDHYIRDGTRPEGLFVSVQHQPMKGEIDAVVGPLGEERKRLLYTAQDPNTIKALNEAPDDVLVVTVRTGQNKYDYPANILNIILTFQNASQFGVSPREISKYTRISPGYRRQLIENVMNTVHDNFVDKGHILKENYDSMTTPDLFPTLFNLPFSEPVTVGKQQVCEFNPKTIMSNLRKYGLYRYSEELRDNKIRIGVLRPSTYGDKKRIVNFLDMIKEELSNLNFTREVTEFSEFTLNDRADLERAVNKLIGSNSDIILALIPTEPDEEGDIEEVDLYHTFKAVTIRKGVGGQVVNYETIDKKYAIPNIVLGILGKTGNIPYVLSKPLDFCDVVVGLDIAREKKRNLPGSKNAAAIARVYFNNGDFMRYTIHDAPLEGETVTPDVIRSLFPMDEFEGKRVVVHRDGIFRGQEKNTLIDWGLSINAKFSLVEIIKRQAPRIYQVEKGRISPPLKGSVFNLDSFQAFLISSPPPFRGSTPRPVRIRNFGPITTEQAIRSVLALTQLHYGSLNPPRMPVTIHYSDKIAGFALRGIKPPELSGHLPFWL